MLPIGNEQLTSFSEDSEEYVRLQREKEKSHLAKLIESKNDERARLIEVLTSVHNTDSEQFTMHMKLEEEKKKVQSMAAEKVEKLKAEIRQKDEEIDSLKKRLSLVNDILKNHSIEVGQQLVCVCDRS